MGWEHIQSLINYTKEDGNPPVAKEQVESNNDEHIVKQENKTGESIGVANRSGVTWADVVKNTKDQQQRKKEVKDCLRKKEHSDHAHSFNQNQSVLVE